MVRKWFLRAVKTCVALFVGGVVAVLVVGYLATRTPGFYANLRAQPELAEDKRQEMEQTVQDMEAWLSKTDRSARDGEAAVTEEEFCFRVGQDQLNEQLAAKGSAGAIRHPRIQLLKDQVQLGIEVGEGSRTFILSCLLTPGVAEDGRLQLEMDSSRIGSLRLPISFILKSLERRINQSSGNIELDASGDRPRLLVEPASSRSARVRISDVRCHDGELEILFSPVPRSLAGKEHGTL